ncbi:glycosyltransferase family 4 protein [Pedobacter terrae]|uniref:glycosyltransferase family 4 protein n=1 Tax=Pedobacter terrae TaxID=405671 RepID=UPI002FF506E9
MRILINASILGQKLNGVGIYTIELLKQLMINFERDDVDYLVYSYDHAHLEFLPKDRLRKIELPAFMEWVCKKSLSVHRLVWNLLVLKKIARAFNLTYSPSTHGYYGSGKQIITIHDLICLSYPYQNRMQYWYFRYLVPLIAKRSLIIAISDFTKQNILSEIKIPSSNIFTVYNGADHLFQQLKETTLPPLNEQFKELANDKYFLTVGANYPHKNIMMLLKVAEALKDTNCKFVIVGCHGNYRSVVENEILSRGLKNVNILPYVTNEELCWLYANCEANLYLTLHEGFGFPPIEAAFFNKISIVSSRSCLPEIYGDTVLYIDPENLEQIVEKVLSFLHDTIDRGKYDNRLKELRERYKWKTAADEIFAVMKNC